MTYIEKNRGNGGKRLTLIVIGFIVLFYIVVQFFIPHFFSSAITSTVSPFWRAEFSIESGSLQSVSSLLRENEALKRELLENSANNSIAKFLTSENVELRNLLGGASSSPVVLSAILKKPPFYIYDEFILDIGEKEKISTTSLVFANGNIPIGRISEIYPKTSKAILFSSPGQKNEVLIGNQNIPAIASGRGGGQYEVELPRGVDVSEGDFVLLAGADTRPIGKVVLVDDSSTLPFQKILFSAPINIYQLRWVLVETK
jgi:cell shape-determining protein MreC